MNEDDSDYKDNSDQIAKMRKMVTSLPDFHNQTRALDANHQAQVDDLNTIIQALFEEPETFTGSAANKLREVVNQYLQTEHSFTGYPGETSPTLFDATKYCKEAVHFITGDLMDLDRQTAAYTEKLKSLAGDNFLQKEWAYFTDGSEVEERNDLNAYEQHKSILPPLLTTLNLVKQMQNDQSVWEKEMDYLASKRLPLLPEAPTNPVPFKADPGSNLYPANEKSLNTLLAEELSKRYGVPLSTVQDIISSNPGLSAEEYALLVQYFGGNQGVPPSHVLSVVDSEDGRSTPITFVTQADIDSIRKQHPGDFSSLSDQQLANLLTQTMQRPPDMPPDDDGLSTRYEYNNVNINGREVTLVIVVSDSDPSHIAESYIKP